jgi:hypothetical protein
MEDKKNLIPVIILLSILLFLTVMFHWAYYVEIVGHSGADKFTLALGRMYGKLSTKIILIKVLLIIALATLFYVSPTHKLNKGEKKENELYWHSATVFFCGLFLLGFLRNELYDFIVYPLILFTLFYFVAKSVNSFKTPTGTDDVLGKVSCKEANDMSFEFMTDKGLMRIHSPQQGIYVEGGAGAGKSASLIEPIIEQAVYKNYTGVIYDFKGNPPTLGRTAYTAALEKKKRGFKIPEGELEPKVGFLSFVDLTRTVRCNPIAPKYLYNKLFISELALTLMVNLQKDWRTKQDFWAANAISYIEGIILMLQKHKPEYCTIPHLVTIGLQKVETVLNWLSQDAEVEMMMKPLAIAFEKNAEGQIAGTAASSQLPIKKLFNKEIFWVLSADEYDLDLNNKEKPSILCVANDPALSESLGPVIAVVLCVCMQKMNQQGKQRSIFCVDELPTVFINKLDYLPATGRSNKVVTCLSVQSYAQLDRDYDSKNATVILGNLGNQFFGMTNEEKTAERVSKMLGEYKRLDTSTTQSESGESTSESYKNEKIMQGSMIASQGIGHFTGKIAGGDPVFYSAQFPEYKQVKSDIPQFSAKVDTGDAKTNKAVMDNLAEANFEKIIREVKEFLAEYEQVNAESTID